MGLVTSTRARCSRASTISREDLAFTGQQFYEECMTQLLQNLRKLGVSDNLVLGGGCGLNSSYDGLLLERTGFRNLYVFSAPADDGNAVGAALLSYQRDYPNWVPRAEVRSPYLGSTLGGESLQNLLRFDRSGMITKHPGQSRSRSAAVGHGPDRWLGAGPGRVRPGRWAAARSWPMPRRM